MRAHVRPAAAVLLVFVATACGDDPASRTRLHSARAVRATVDGFLHAYAHDAGAACEKYLLPPARRQEERADGYHCERGRGAGIVDPYRLRVGFLGPGRVEVRYALKVRGLCGSRHRIRERRDILVLTETGWKYSRFGFGHVRCVRR